MPDHPFHLPLVALNQTDDGVTHFTVDRLTRVGVRHLVEVTSHTVTDAFGSRSHVLHFINGGVLMFAYNHDELLELQATNLGMHVTPEGEALFYVPHRRQPCPASAQ